MSLVGRHIAFRSDASVRIGSGHVMRCLTLADALVGAGATCCFVMRAHDGHLGTLVETRGHVALLLPSGDGRVSNGPTHAGWLGTDWENDAVQTRSALTGSPVDLLIVDHYALDRRWETALRDLAPRRMVIDDLADREHDADLLLDQNLGTSASDYAALLPAHARRLIGPRYALLRPEFAAARARLATTASADRALRHVLIAVSGTDADNVSEQLLDRLDTAGLPADVAITVILGNSAPHVGAVRARTARMHPPTQLLVGVNDMSRILAEVDLCIGATGGMSWERCCLGLPTLLLVLADNQIKAAAALAGAGAGLLVGDIRHPDWALRFDAQLKAALDPRQRDAMHRRAMAICDGQGTKRIVEALEGLWKD